MINLDDWQDYDFSHKKALIAKDLAEENQNTTNWLGRKKTHQRLLQEGVQWHIDKGIILPEDADHVRRIVGLN